jgi:A/G-specific adenine glycosylase
VWISEIMLQQTRVEAVIPYFERFVKRFPDIRALASAREEEVLELWSGLGYYRRARSLHAAARVLVVRHDGKFPEDERDMLAIPGIGRYTAGAIRSIALGLRAPILDGNVTRVLARVFGIEGDVSERAVSGTLWSIAERAVARGIPSEVNQGQMEIGALVCRPVAPLCANCPLARFCTAFREKRVGELPELPRRRHTVHLRCTALLVRRGGEILLRRRLPGELLAGLWDLPGAFTGGQGDRPIALEDVVETLPFPVSCGEKLGTFRHAVTYRRIVLDVLEAVSLEAPPREESLSRRRRGGQGPRAAPLRAADGAELLFCTTEQALGKALSSPARRILVTALTRGIARP